MHPLQQAPVKNSHWTSNTVLHKHSHTKSTPLRASTKVETMKTSNQPIGTKNKKNTRCCRYCTSWLFLEEPGKVLIAFYNIVYCIYGMLGVSSRCFSNNPDGNLSSLFPPSFAYTHWGYPSVSLYSQVSPSAQPNPEKVLQRQIPS